MSKRTDTIRSMFTAPLSESLSGDNDSLVRPRVASGSVRSMKDSFTGIERENDTLRAAMASGVAIVELDPATIDSSPVTDRFADTDKSSFETLKASIKANGQEVPILVRRHPESLDRYQAAYGHRRIRALRELGRPIKAIVRNLTDRELAIAQGVENSARQDLTFIERAVFAMRLENAGHDRSVIQEALSIDRAEASKLVSVARTIPIDLIAAIGRAPKVGRGRWQAFADHLKAEGSIESIHEIIADPSFAKNDSDARFLIVLSAITAQKETVKDAFSWIRTQAGDPVARVTHSESEVRVFVDRRANAGFAVYLLDRLPDLFEKYRRASQEGTGEE